MIILAAGAKSKRRPRTKKQVLQSELHKPEWLKAMRLSPAGWYCCSSLMKTGDLMGGEQIRVCSRCQTSIRTAHDQLLSTLPRHQRTQSAPPGSSLEQAVLPIPRHTPWP